MRRPTSSGDVDTIIARNDVNISVVDGDHRALEPLIGVGDPDVAAIDLQGLVGMHAVIAGRKDERTAVDRHVAVGGSEAVQMSSG